MESIKHALNFSTLPNKTRLGTKAYIFRNTVAYKNKNTDSGESGKDIVTNVYTKAALNKLTRQIKIEL